MKKMEQEKQLAVLKNAIGTYPDFPKPGILFKDVFGIFRDVVALKALKSLVVKHASSLEVDAIVGLDARGFLLGPLISVELDKPFIPIRKKGKLPGEVVQQTYKLEYGEDTLEIQKTSISKGNRILIVDDLLATGGTMEAAVQLLTTTGAVVVECLVVIELTNLNGRSKLSAPVHSFIQFD